MDETPCYQCGTTEPMADHLGWLEVGYSRAPEWRRRFCGGACLNAWSRAAMERLTRAVLGEAPPQHEPSR
jgi:hypothetical protein